MNNYQTTHTDKMHVVERFRLLDGGKMLQGRLTVQDPGTFNAAWSAAQTWQRTNCGR